MKCDGLFWPMDAICTTMLFKVAIVRKGE